MPATRTEAEATGTINVTGGGASATGFLYIDGGDSTSTSPDGTLSITADLAPGSDGEIASWVIWKDGNKIIPGSTYRLEGDVRVTRTRDGGATASFRIGGDGLSEVSESLGSACPLWVDASIDIGIAYQGGGSLVEHRLITGGKVHRSEVDLLAGAIRVDVLDASAEIDRATVSYQLAAGASRSVDAIAGSVLSLAGYTGARSLSGGHVVRKAVAETDVSPLALIRELYQPTGRHVAVDKAGALVTRRRAAADGRTAYRTLKAYHKHPDVLRAGLRLSSVETGVARTWKVEGTQQITSNADEGCALVTLPSNVVEVETIGHVVVQAVQSQDSAGAMVATTYPTPTAKDLITSRVIVKREQRCGEDVSVVTETYAMVPGPQAHRYRQGTDGAPLLYNAGVWLYQASSKDDSTSAFLYPRHRLELIQRETKTIEHDSDGYAIAETKVTQAYYNPEVRLKGRGLSTIPWEDVPYELSVKLEGSGRGVTYDFERFLETRREKLTRQVLLINEKGYIQSETIIVSGWVVVPGSLYLYKGEIGSSHSAEQYQEMQKKVITYSAGDDGTHTISKATQNLVTGQAQVETSQGRGFLPAAPKMTTTVANSSAYNVGEDTGAAESASPYDQAAIEGTQYLVSIAPDELPCGEERVERLSSKWAETQQQLENLARWALLDRLSRDITIPLLGAFPGESEDQVLTLSVGTSASNAASVRVVVTEAEWSGGDQVLCTLRGKVYPS